jgi:hypothetical protein
MKSHDSIKNITIAAIKRHSMDIDKWVNTSISFHDFPSQIERLDSELPILSFVLTDSDWTIITTRRIIGKISNDYKQIDFNELDDIVYGDYKNTKKSTTIFRTTDFHGENTDFLMETGKPSIEFIYSINTIHGLYRNESEPYMINRDDDFIAVLNYRTSEQGGRKTPAHSGYRPQVKFDFEEMQTSGQQTFIDKEIVNPGETVKARIKILSVDYFSNCLTEGMSFEFREGNTIIGTGEITEILNDKLKKPAGNTKYK